MSAAITDPDSRAAEARAARTRLLLTGPVGATLARLAAPNILAMLVSAAMNISEAAFAGMIGVSALAGIALVYPLVMLVQMLSAGSMGGAISSAVSRALGAGEAARAERLVVAAWVIAGTIALAFAVVLLLFGAPMFAALSGGGEAGQQALAYAMIYFPGCIAVWLTHSTLSVIRGCGNMAMPSLLLTGASIATIPLSGALALGWGPFPVLGLAGLALGQISVFTVTALIAVFYVISGRAGLRVSGIGLGLHHFADILRVGAASSLNALQTVITIVAITAIVGQFGEAALAGYGLGARLEFIMVPVVFGVGAAMTAMVGANIGAGNRDRALRIGWTGSVAAGAIVGGVGLFFALFPDLWLGLFLEPDNAAALAAGRSYFRTVAPFYALFALGLALYFASQGAGRVFWPILGGGARMIVAIGGALALTNAGFGLVGVFAAIAGGMAAYGLVTALGIALTRWR